MLGAIIGDIVGSIYEFRSEKTKSFPLFSPGCSPTDDSLMTMAVGVTCVSANTHNESEFKHTLALMMREIGRQYPDAGYGGRFFDWLMSDTMGPYILYADDGFEDKLKAVSSETNFYPILWKSHKYEGKKFGF